MVCMAIFRARKFQNLSYGFPDNFSPLFMRIQETIIDQGASYFHDRLASGRPSQADTLMAVFAP